MQRQQALQYLASQSFETRAALAGWLALVLHLVSNIARSAIVQRDMARIRQVSSSALASIMGIFHILDPNQ